MTKDQQKEDWNYANELLKGCYERLTAVDEQLKKEPNEYINSSLISDTFKTLHGVRNILWLIQKDLENLPDKE